MNDHLTESLREGQVPADQHTDFSEWGIEDWMGVTRGAHEVQTFNVTPEVFLDVFPKDLASRRDEVGHIDKTFAVFIIFGEDASTVMLSIGMQLYDGSRDDADVALSSKGLVLFEIFLPACTRCLEIRIVRQPVGKMVFWENCQFGTLLGS